MIHANEIKKTQKSKFQQTTPDHSYSMGAKAYRKGSYDESLTNYLQYLNQCKIVKCPTVKKIFSIDMIGSIYIRVQKNPSKLIKSFDKLLKKSEFNDAVQDEIEDWILSSKEWINNKKFPWQVKKAEEMFKLGNFYYDRGSKKKKYPMDRSGNADFSIAASYYIPYIYEFSQSKHVDQALLKMGLIRSTLWTDKEFWSSNFYLKEVIRRFPNSNVSKKAFKTLKEEVHFSYSGSAGDSTPPSQLEMLNYFDNIANGKFDQIKGKRNSLF
jgi:hypothetical protein